MMLVKAAQHLPQSSCVSLPRVPRKEWKAEANEVLYIPAAHVPLATEVRRAAVKSSHYKNSRMEKIRPIKAVLLKLSDMSRA